MAADLTIRSVSAAAPLADGGLLSASAPRVTKAADPAQKFEAFVLQSFIQEMMPDTAEGVYGSGLAGDFWKSMMAEKIAEQVAERGSVGIANYISGAGSGAVRPAASASPDVVSHLTTWNANTVTQRTSGSGE